MTNGNDTEDFCEFFLDSVSDGIGGGFVFRYHGLVACENYKCPYKNHDGRKLQHEGDGPVFGFCRSEGHQICLEDRTATNNI